MKNIQKKGEKLKAEERKEVAVIEEYENVCVDIVVFVKQEEKSSSYQFNYVIVRN